MEYTIQDQQGRTYRYRPTEISNEHGLRSGQWDAQNCVLLVLKQVGDIFELINVSDITGSSRVSNYFASWHMKGDDGRSIHIDSQLGATHYAVVRVEYEGFVSRVANSITEANETTFIRLWNQSKSKAMKHKAEEEGKQKEESGPAF